MVHPYLPLLSHLPSSGSLFPLLQQQTPSCHRAFAYAAPFAHNVFPSPLTWLIPLHPSDFSAAIFSSRKLSLTSLTRSISLFYAMLSSSLYTSRRQELLVILPC